LHSIHFKRRASQVSAPKCVSRCRGQRLWTSPGAPYLWQRKTTWVTAFPLTLPNSWLQLIIKVTIGIPFWHVQSFSIQFRDNLKLLPQHYTGLFPEMDA